MRLGSMLRVAFGKFAGAEALGLAYRYLRFCDDEGKYLPLTILATQAKVTRNVSCYCSMDQ
jgi:hypothetical protein